MSKSDWISFTRFAEWVLPGDQFRMQNTKTPGLDVREGFVLDCIGAAVDTINPMTGEKGKSVPVRYPKGIPYYSNGIGSIGSYESTNVLFEIL